MATQDVVTVSIVGTGTTEGGGVAPTPSGTIAKVPDPTQPDLRINVVTPTIAIAVRFVHLFLITLVGLMGSEQIGVIDVGGLREQALVALSAAGVGFLKDLVTVFGRLEGRYPLVTGSI